MKQKWFDLTWPQRVMIFIQAFLVLLFLILYCTMGRQRVIEYNDEYLRCRTEDEITTYTGKISGQKAVFTVTENTVEYHLGKTVYGPYTIVEDPTAVPSEEDKPILVTSLSALKGIEVWEGEERLFRGSYLSSSTFLLFDENGEHFSTFSISSNGMELKEVSPGSYVYGPATDAAPSIRTIVQLVVNPDVVQRGHFGIYLLGVLFCVLNAVSILYADKLFRWDLRFRIADPESAEPSDWELFSRWIGWIMITICALAVFILGLNYG